MLAMRRLLRCRKRSLFSTEASTAKPRLAMRRRGSTVARPPHVQHQQQVTVPEGSEEQTAAMPRRQRSRKYGV